MIQLYKLGTLIGLSLFTIGTDIFLIPVALIIRYIVTKFDLMM